MAADQLGEQFGSRSITHTATGSHGTRIFVELWQDRYKSTLPRIGKIWPSEAGEVTEVLVVHDFAIEPFAQSGTKGTSHNVAKYARITYHYDGSVPLTSNPMGWLISCNSTIQAVPAGKNRSFFQNRTHKIEGTVNKYIPMTEITIRGLDYLGENPTLKDIAGPTQDAHHRLGTACKEVFRRWVRGQLLFQGEDLSEPFVRQTCQPDKEATPNAWYREFTRKFLLKSVGYMTTRGYEVVAGHNMEWDGEAGAWDTVIDKNGKTMYVEQKFGEDGIYKAIFPGLQPPGD